MTLPPNMEIAEQQYMEMALEAFTYKPLHDSEISWWKVLGCVGGGNFFFFFSNFLLYPYINP